MKPLRLFLLGIISLAAFAADKPVQLAPFKANLSDIYFLLSFDSVSHRVAEVRVTGVLEGSAAEKIGISEGDRLTSINGLPVAGRKPNEIWDPDSQTIFLSGPVTFTGRRGSGFFRKAWTITVDGAELKNKKEPSPPPLLVPATSPDPWSSGHLVMTNTPVMLWDEAPGDGAKIQNTLRFELRKGVLFHDGSLVDRSDWWNYINQEVQKTKPDNVMLTPDGFRSVEEFIEVAKVCRLIRAPKVLLNLAHYSPRTVEEANALKEKSPTSR